MIVVDSSIWIDHFTGRANRFTALLARLVAQAGELVIGDVVLYEVLCGYRDERAYRAVRADLAAFPIVTMTGLARFEAALARHRRLRQRGVTAAMADMLIGSFCLSERAALLSRDTGFIAMRDHLGLALIDPTDFPPEAS